MMALRPHAAQTAAQVATKLAASAPKAEALLQQAHASLEVLEAAGARLVRQGLAGDAVPGRPALMAMALLGEHGRGDVLQALEPCWDDLCSKALAHGNLTDDPAPVLRLLLAVQPATLGLDDVQTRLAVLDAPEAPASVLRCVRRLKEVLWGQRVRVHFQTSGVDYLLLTPDEAFAVGPTLLNLGGGPHQGSFELVGNEGDVVFTLLDSLGQVFRQTLTLQLHDPRAALNGW